MNVKITLTILLLLLIFAAMPAHAVVYTTPPSDDTIPEQVLGKTDAPIIVEEYVSLTCSHCAEFYNDVLPELEKRYVDSGKVRFILRDFPLDGVALKAAIIARCMPSDQFYPFIKMLYKNQTSWISTKEPEKTLMQYAKLGGLSEEKAKSCLADTKLQDALIASRTNAAQNLNIQATPTFIINKGAEIFKGAQTIDKFSKSFDLILSQKH